MRDTSWVICFASLLMEVRFVDVKARKSYARRLPCVVGRGDDADFRIKNDSVSRRHCEFALHEGVVHVTDMESTNGTAVDNRQLEPRVATAVSSGSRVRIGGVVLRVEYKVTAAATTAPADTVPWPANAESSGVEALVEPDAATVDEAAMHEAAPPSESLPELEPAEEAAPVAGHEPADTPVAAPAFPDIEPAAPPPAADLSFPDVEPAAPAAEGSFDFLGGEAAAAPESDDDKLDDFFKSIS